MYNMYIQWNFASSNLDGSNTMDHSNCFFSPVKFAINSLWNKPLFSLWNYGTLVAQISDYSNTFWRSLQVRAIVVLLYTMVFFTHTKVFTIYENEEFVLFFGLWLHYSTLVENPRHLFFCDFFLTTQDISGKYKKM